VAVASAGAIYKSAPRPRLITKPAAHHSLLYIPDALPATQPTASKHWRHQVHHQSETKRSTLQIYYLGHELVRLTYKLTFIKNVN